MSTEERIRVLKAYVGQRGNRRHRPGRAFERSTYCFDVLTDYGAFRDLQRHRVLSIDWQPLEPIHGFAVSAAIEEVGAGPDWRRVMDESAELHDRLVAESSTLVAQYAVSMAYRIRFYMHMNAREAMHVIELRTLIANHAGHRAIAEAMTFADHTQIELERLKAERAGERRCEATGR